jgi:S-adenosylmethionine hydrolase
MIQYHEWSANFCNSLAFLWYKLVPYYPSLSLLLLVVSKNVGSSCKPCWTSVNNSKNCIIFYSLQSKTSACIRTYNNNDTFCLLQYLNDQQQLEIKIQCRSVNCTQSDFHLPGRNFRENVLVDSSKS